MSLILQILISSVAVYFTAWLLPGISVKSFGSSIIVAIVLGLLNTLLKPVLQFLSFPITILTLGLFLLVINTVIILIASAIMGNSFHVKNFWWALLFSIVMSIVASVLESIL
ncbi:phage holin family protein [Bacteroides sp. 224]|uniref:phage holin family protein n=1 Tax=Bacteroides sp. 224 TaxID=2302936 RepID=UPI0013D04123|nr:phage holin family protein [Bacteroides sp. 224]NDV66133.1 phage holin family protein [Bacteroides sp. 224]